MPKPSTYQALPKDDIPANSKMNAASSNHTSTTGLPPNIFAAPAKVPAGSGLSEVEKKETKETNPELVAAMEKPEAGTVVEWKEVEALRAKKREEVEALAEEWEKKKKKKKKKEEEKRKRRRGRRTAPKTTGTASRAIQTPATWRTKKARW
ncbi:hypothetical protein QC762_0031830 [Podospora pseudocomata]|uniref:Uncharacterized protein n=1 Tax=Podospora pseudocomata TaxID=2093779 RepID=A0ABR0GPW7_9PEZI|nr:hypothetical protein QC762_0031830 [Podospora pseudocomata]